MCGAAVVWRVHGTSHAVWYTFALRELRYFVSVALLAALSIYNVAIRPVYDGALSGYKSSELPMDESADWSFRPKPEGHDANSSPLVDITAIV
jgi:hypothetical protein